jgi:hypothetical protein
VAVVVLLVVTAACAAGADPRKMLWIPPEAAIMLDATSYPSGNADVAFTVAISDLSQKEAWYGEWQDSGGNVMVYSLLASRLREGQGDEVRAYGAYVPVNLVNAGLRGRYR